MVYVVDDSLMCRYTCNTNKTNALEILKQIFKIP